MYGPVLSEHARHVRRRDRAVLRMALDPVLTRPFGEVSLADLMNAPQQKVAEARGIEAETRRSAAIVRRFREQRKVRAMADAGGSTTPSSTGASSC